jgi:DNA-binding transcriptional LysR family regulator
VTSGTFSRSPEPVAIHHGDREKELVRLIGTTPGLVSEIWLLVHPDMRQTPRVRTFFDYVIAELKDFRALREFEK